MVKSTKYLKKKTINFLILCKFFFKGIEEKLYDHFNRFKKKHHDKKLSKLKFAKNIREIP